MKTHLWLLVSLSCVGFFGLLFSLLAKSWQVQSGLISVVLYLSFLCPELSGSNFEDQQTISNIQCSFIYFCALQTELYPVSNSKIGSNSFRQDWLFLLNKFDNSLIYSLIKEMHSHKTGVSMVVYCEGLTLIYQWKFFFLTFANAKYEQFP